jgi:hypothetical protein
MVNLDSGSRQRLAGNVEALAMWRYAVFRLPGAAAE